MKNKAQLAILFKTKATRYIGYFMALWAPSRTVLGVYLAVVHHKFSCYLVGYVLSKLKYKLLLDIVFYLVVGFVNTSIIIT